MAGDSTAIFQPFSSSCGSQSLEVSDKRLGCNMHMLVAECVLLSEPSLGAVCGKQEDFTPGIAGTDLPQVFKPYLCVAAWQASVIALDFMNLLSSGTSSLF